MIKPFRNFLSECNFEIVDRNVPDISQNTKFFKTKNRKTNKMLFSYKIGLKFNILLCNLFPRKTRDEFNMFMKNPSFFLILFQRV